MEDEFAVMVVNAAHMKTAPGRKTDAKSLPRTGYGDAEWIAELLQHGLLRAGFIPPRPQRELRELTRYRRSLVEERSREANPDTEVAGGSQHQAILGGHRRAGRFGAGHAGGPGRG